MKTLHAVLLSGLLLGWPAATATEPQAPAAHPHPTAVANPGPGPGLEHFEPSEELPADSAISFPVDI
jgi:hypothetical protein